MCQWQFLICVRCDERRLGSYSLISTVLVVSDHPENAFFAGLDDLMRFFLMLLLKRTTFLVPFLAALFGILVGGLFWRAL